MTDGRLRVILAGTLYPQPEGLRLFLEESGYEVLGEVETPEALFATARRGQPDLVVLGPELIDPDLVGRLREVVPQVGIVAVAHERPRKGVLAPGDGHVVQGSSLGALTTELSRVAVASARPAATRTWFGWTLPRRTAGRVGPIAASIAILTGAWILLATFPEGALPPVADVPPSRTTPAPTSPVPTSASPLALARGSLERLVEAVVAGDFERATAEAQELARQRELALEAGLAVDSLDAVVAAELGPLTAGLPERVVAQLNAILGDLLPPPSSPTGSPPASPSPQAPTPTTEPTTGPTTGPTTEPTTPPVVAPVDVSRPVLDCDAVAPGWHGANVAVQCTARDPDSGLAHPGDETFVLRTDVAEGRENADARTDARTVCDREGNCATAGPIGGIKVDRKAPGLSCGQPAGAWHGDDVAIACSAADGGSGLAELSDQGFALSTHVPAGSEDANARTDSHRVCDAVGNCATAGPIGGIKVDRKAPTISIRSPASGAVYLLNQRVAADFDCADTGAGIGSCTGPDQVETSSVGGRSFQVEATDLVGNGASSQLAYVVTYGVELLGADPPGRSKKLELRLVDASGGNVSAEAITVTAVDIDGSPFDERFSYRGSSKSYRVTLPHDLEDGEHVLHFIAEGDPVVHSVVFTIG